MPRIVCLAMVIWGLSGCRIVSQQELADLKNPPNPHMAAVTQTWQQKLVPQIVNEARPVNELLKALRGEKDFDSACQAFGWRSQQENPCVFAVRISGTVVQLNTASRSGKMVIQDRGGQAVTVQIGPTIRGTALRDGYKGVSYQDFNDQVLFGDYARAINDRAAAMIQQARPKIGESLEVEGVFAAWDLPPTLPEVTPARISKQTGGQ